MIQVCFVWHQFLGFLFYFELSSIAFYLMEKSVVSLSSSDLEELIIYKAQHNLGKILLMFTKTKTE